MTTTFNDLIEEWNRACVETHINNTRSNFIFTYRAAKELECWYENRFRENRSFEDEERMRYWRMVAAQEAEKTRSSLDDDSRSEWHARRDQYIRCLRRNPNTKERLKGFLRLTSSEKMLAIIIGGLLLAILPAITLSIINPQ